MAQQNAGPQGLHSGRVAVAIFYGVLLLLGYLVFRIFQPFLAPLGWAGVLVIAFYPLHRRMERRWGPGRAAALSTLAVTLILVLPVTLLATAFVREGVSALQEIEAARSRGEFATLEKLLPYWERIQQRLPFTASIDLRQTAVNLLQVVGQAVVAGAGKIFVNVASFVFSLLITLFAAFYLFRDAGEIVARVRQVIPFEPALRDRMLQQAGELVSASVTATLVVAATQGLLGGGAFALLGLGKPVLWGVAMALFSLVPVVGSSIIWLPAAIWLFVQGATVRGIILVVVGVGVIGMVDNVLRPLLVGGRSRLNSLLIFISVLGGLAVFGTLGLVLGPIVVATTFGLLDAYTRQPAETSAPAATAALRSGSVARESPARSESAMLELPASKGEPKAR
jgi:predicted PurR-regulated permease PerM